MKSRMLALAGLVCLSFTGSVSAQPPGGPGGFGRMMQRQVSVTSIPVEALDKKLKLKDEQKTKIKDIQDKIAKARQDMMPRPDPNGGPPDFEAMREKMEAFQKTDKEAGEEIGKLLDEDQQKKLPDVVKEAQIFQASEIPLPLLGKLTLTEKQAKELKAITDASQKKMQAKIEALTNGGGDPQEMREFMQENRKATREKVQAVLTEEQRKEIAAYIKEHPQPRRRGFGG